MSLSYHLRDSLSISGVSISYLPHNRVFIRWEKTFLSYKKRLIHKISLWISLVVSYKTRLNAMNVDFATPDGANYSLMPSLM